MKLLLAFLATHITIACAKQATMSTLQNHMSTGLADITQFLKQCTATSERTNSLEDKAEAAITKAKTAEAKATAAEAKASTADHPAHPYPTLGMV